MSLFHSDVDVLSIVASFLPPSDRFCFRLVMKSYSLAVFEGKTKSCVKDYVNTLQRALLAMQFVPLDKVWHAATQQGSELVVKYLHHSENDDRVHHRASTNVAGSGNIRLLEWMRCSCRKSKYPWMQHTTALAAERGRLEVLRWLRGQYPPCPMDESAVQMAAFGAHVHVLRWLLETEPPLVKGNMPVLCRYACMSEDPFLVLHWVEANGLLRVDSRCVQMAVTVRRRDVVEWLYERGARGDASCCSAAAWKGDLPMLQWLRGKGCPWNVWTIVDGSWNMEILRWARTPPCCPWNASTLSLVVRRGHVDAVTFMVENGCPVAESALIEAAYVGRIDILEVLHPRFPSRLWTSRVYESALQGKKEGVLEWLDALTPPPPKPPSVSL